MFWAVSVAAANASLLELVKLAAIIPRSFAISLYCVVVPAVICSKMMLLLVGVEVRDSKLPSY